MGVNPAEVDGPEKAIEIFNTSYINKSEAIKDQDIIGKVAGKITGSINTKLKSLAPDLDFNSEDLKDKKTEEKIDFISKHINGKFTSLEDQLKLSGSGDIQKIKSDHDKQIKNWEKKYYDVEGLLTNVKLEFESTKKTYLEKDEKDAIQSEWNNTWKNIPWNKEFIADEDAVVGFQVNFAKKFKTVREDNKVVITDVDGKKIPSKEEPGEFMALSEALTSFAKEKNKVTSSPAAGKRTGNIAQAFSQTVTDTNKSDLSVARARNRSSVLGSIS